MRYDRNDRHEWDGIERRRTERYEPEPEIIIQSPKLNWLAIIPIILTILTPIAGFIFNLYDKSNELEYKIKSMGEKLDERKVDLVEMDEMIKKQDTKFEKIQNQLNSIEQTMMELYRRK